MKFLIGIFIGLIIGAIITLLVSTLTPLGKRFTVKSVEDQLIRTDKWTGDTWLYRYYEEDNGEGKRIRIWHWDKIMEDSDAIEQAIEIRDLAQTTKEKKRKEREAEQQRIQKELEIQAEKEALERQKEKERKKKVAAEQRAIENRYKNIAKRCETFEECIKRECKNDESCFNAVLYYHCKGNHNCIKEYCKNRYEFFPDIHECTMRLLR